MKKTKLSSPMPHNHRSLSSRRVLASSSFSLFFFVCSLFLRVARSLSCASLGLAAAATTKTLVSAKELLSRFVEQSKKESIEKSFSLVACPILASEPLSLSSRACSEFIRDTHLSRERKEIRTQLAVLSFSFFSIKEETEKKTIAHSTTSTSTSSFRLFHST